MSDLYKEDNSPNCTNRKTCPHCGFPIEDKYDFCTACEWMHLGLSPEVETKVVVTTQFVLAAYQQHYTVKTVKDVHQLMVDLMYGSEDDEQIMETVGMLRRILSTAVDQELAQRGYSPEGVPL